MGLRWFGLFRIGEIGEQLRYATGYHMKKAYLSCQTSHSRVARPTSVGSPESADTNLGPHTHYEVDSGIGLELGHEPMNLSSLLQRAFEDE